MKETIFSSVPLVGIMLLVTGIILWSSRWANQNGRDIKRATLGDAFIIGFAQGIAVLPGISRSGFTIVAGLFSGIERQTAARYSFLLSIPAIMGALLLELIGTDVPSNISIWNIMIGIVTSAIVGFVTLKILLNMVNNGKLYLFAPYCWAMGVALLVSQFWIPY
jgi:undecaprenyl-diphosphatase